MDTPQQKAKRNAPRFDTALQARMREIGLTTFEALAANAGITVTTLSALRKGQNYPSAKSAWGLDTALRWQTNPSSTVALFEGGDPVALPDEPTEDVVEDPDEQKILAMQHLSAEKKQQIIDRMRANRQAALEEAAALNEVSRLRGHKGSDNESRSRSA